MHSINTFIDKIKFLETKNAKEFSMTMREAKDLHGDITKLLVVLQELTQNHNKSQEPIQVELKGDGF
jgi:hypothetical protein